MFSKKKNLLTSLFPNVIFGTKCTRCQALARVELQTVARRGSEEVSEEVLKGDPDEVSEGF